MNEKLYKKCKNKGLKFNHVSEVGVYLPETSNIMNFIKDGIRATLVEADPEYILKINKYFHSYKNVTLFPYAVWDRSGFITLNKANSSSFIDELEISPAIVNDNFISTAEKKIIVEAKTFDEIDDGTIDLISVDIEGSEWFVLKHLESRPNIISLETHWKNYLNPFMEEINKWMSENNYETWYIDKSDTVFMQRGLFELNKMEKLKLRIRNDE